MNATKTTTLTENLVAVNEQINIAGLMGHAPIQERNVFPKEMDTKMKQTSRIKWEEAHTDVNDGVRLMEN